MKGERATAALSSAPATDGLASVTNAGGHIALMVEQSARSTQEFVSR